MKQYANFCSALQKMKDIYDYNEPYSPVILTGIAYIYKACFEQSWKLMQHILIEQGYDECATGSPKKTIKAAAKAGIIQDEELWIMALQAHKNVSYSYDENIARRIVTSAKNEFYDMFVELRDEIRKS